MYTSPWEFARRYAEKTERLVIGLMSGTSVDGVDAALVGISGSMRDTRAELLASTPYPFPASLRERVLAISHGQGNAEEVSRLNVELGRLFANAALAVLRDARLSPADIDLIASHGQTVSHTPETSLRARLAGGDTAATLQIGEASIIAQRVGVPVLSDFRAADMAAGGQGAPLVPYVDWCLLTHPTKARCVQNIGGIGNVTFLPPDAAPEKVIGFDTGPGNMLMDRSAQWATGGVLTYDRHGALAASGAVVHDLLEPLLVHPFLQVAPPKSAGREEFGEAFWEKWLRSSFSRKASPNDIVATMTAFTAASIADSYERFLPQMPDEVIVSGGGARNPVLMRLLREKLSPIPVLPGEEMGINGDMKEAIAFAVLSNETMLGNPSNLPSVTGASRPVILGKITLP